MEVIFEHRYEKTNWQQVVKQLLIFKQNLESEVVIELRFEKQICNKYNKFDCPFPSQKANDNALVTR